MPKKEPVHPKALEAKAVKEQVAARKAALEAKAKEDSLWAEEGTPKKKAEKKKQERETKKQEATQKKAEVEMLKQQEESEMARLSRRGVRGPKSDPLTPKVTRADLDRLKEEQERRKEKAERLRQQQARREQDEREYARQYADVAINNKASTWDSDGETGVDARSVASAIVQLGSVALTRGSHQSTWNGPHVASVAVPRGPGDGTGEGVAREREGLAGGMDKQTERKAREAYKVYEEAELPRVRKEFSKRTVHQCKEILWERWKKAHS